MKKILFLLLVVSYSTVRAAGPASYVQPMIGTGGVGHTFPGATVPFGMVQVSPDTRIDGSWEGCAGYHYSDSLIYGFSHTHLSGTGCTDYGDILLLPGSDQINFKPSAYASLYSHKTEKASAGYYAVTLAKNNIACELTATTRTGMHRYTYPKSMKPSVLLDLVHRDKVLASSLHVVNDHAIEGFRRSEAWARDQHCYFYMEFSKPFEKIMLEGRETPLAIGERIDGTSIRAAALFSSSAENVIMVKTGISTVSERNAQFNLQAENQEWNFDEIKLAAFDSWNQELNKIEVKGGSEKAMTNFYTSLYHTMVVPNVISDVNGEYRGRDGKVHRANGYTQYTVFSLWDTFRAAHPLYALIDKKRTRDFMMTFIAQYDQGGLLPVWELAGNETDCMIGYHSVSVIADAIDKGITDFDIPHAYEAMKASSNSGQRGLAVFNKNYLLQIDDESESVSKALEYAYDDWCIAQVARYLRKDDEAKLYDTRAASYINMYDASTGFMRPRRNGSWLEHFDPREVNNHYTEANSYQYSFFVPQDVSGMIDLMGGPDAFDKKLDGLFNAPQNTTGRMQADITGMIGQYAHGNEPSHHMAYLYDYIGKPYKTQEIVHKILDSLYVPTFDGLPGNEDCGQMSAWFVWSAMGFYPVSPGSSMYALGTPLFNSITVHLENGKSIAIRASRKNPDDFYVDSWSLNGVKQQSNFLDERQTRNGATIDFVLRSSRSNRGSEVEKLTALNKSGFIPAPFIVAHKRNFVGSTDLEINAASDAKIYYSFSGNDKDMQLYSGPIKINESSKLYAFAEKNGVRSGIVMGSFYKLAHPEWTVSLINQPSKQYSAEGPMSMIDGVEGTTDWRKGDWHGYQDKDMIVEIDLKSAMTVSKVTAGFLQDTRAWILFPKNFILETSLDGKTWSDAGNYTFTVPANNYDVQILRPEINLNNVSARYVRLTAKTFGALPEWHLGAGYPAYIFSDEITVQAK